MLVFLACCNSKVTALSTVRQKQRQRVNRIVGWKPRYFLLIIKFILLVARIFHLTDTVASLSDPLLYPTLFLLILFYFTFLCYCFGWTVGFNCLAACFVLLPLYQIYMYMYIYMYICICICTYFVLFGYQNWPKLQFTTLLRLFT